MTIKRNQFKQQHAQKNSFYEQTNQADIIVRIFFGLKNEFSDDMLDVF